MIDRVNITGNGADNLIFYFVQGQLRAGKKVLMVAPRKELLTPYNFESTLLVKTTDERIVQATRCRSFEIVVLIKPSEYNYNNPGGDPDQLAEQRTKFFQNPMIIVQEQLPSDG